MAIYEYKVVPAPEKGLKGKGVKGHRERFANALQTLMNKHGADGWEYVRADTLPCEERSGLMTSSSTSFLNMLVFRRDITPTDGVTRAQPEQVPAPVLEQGEAVQVAEIKSEFSSARNEESVESSKGTPPVATDAAAAAAAAAALTAYRESSSSAPKLGPAPERHPDKE